MQHADALSRNPVVQEEAEEDDCFVHRVDIEEDWLIAAQSSDPSLKKIKEVLKQNPDTEEMKYIHKKYVLKQDRVYCNTPRRPLWVVPRGMRHELVRMAHGAVRHCAVGKTLDKLNEAYWFQGMRSYVDKFIKCCIPCLYAKRKAGKPEGLLNPIPKRKEPLHTLHVDHLGHFPKSPRRNDHLIVVVDGFTKLTFLRAVKSTNARLVIEYLRDLFATYGTPKIIITGQGSAFTSRSFKEFCDQNQIKHIKISVAAARANGQVERLNRAVLGALVTTTVDERRWDENIRDIQLAVNNTVNQSTKKTPSQLLLGYTPRSGEDMWLRDEVQETSRVIEDIVAVR